MTSDRIVSFRRFYAASRSRFWFLVAGLPILAFMGVIFASYMVFFTVMLFVPMAVIAIAMLPGTIKRRNFYSYGLKIGIIFMIVFTGLVPNPLIWGQQISRRLDHRQLITPREPSVMALNDTSNLWAYISSRYSGATPQQFKTWTIHDQVWRIFYYINYLIDYEYDIDTSGVFDHVATPREVLASGKDDCQGISCVLASLLIYLGYNAWIAECPFHWYVRVFYVNGTGQTNHVDVYRYSRNSDPFFLFNMDETVFPAQLGWTIETAFSDTYIAAKYSEIVNGTGGTLDLSVFGSSFPETKIPMWLAWLVVFGACLLVGFLASILTMMPRFKRSRWYEKTVSPVAFATPLFIGFLGITFVPIEAFLMFALLMIGLAVFMLDAVLLVKSAAQAITRWTERRPRA
ncbi:MAG: hypothetical protein GYA24_16695 [Candidatus Lokiarchaeota archaeon]|nr:hypothetical protein [Candidatus Lokiarchaeota archaeon]